MPEKCPECGAVLRSGWACRDYFDALLFLESDLGLSHGALLSSTDMQAAHFYTVSCYVLQHPIGMRYTVAAIQTTKDNLEQYLAETRSIADIRQSISQAPEKVRILRGDDETPHDWGITKWSMTTADVLALGASEYLKSTQEWAIATISDINHCV